MNGFHVSTGDLKGWSADVGRQSRYVTDVANYGSSNLADTDFGKILELVTGSYRTLVPQFLSIIREAATNLGHEQGALGAALAGYLKEEAKTRAHLDKQIEGEARPDALTPPAGGGPSQRR